MATKKKYYTLEEIAKLWKLTPNQVRNLFNDKLRILRADVERVYREHQVK